MGVVLTLAFTGRSDAGREALLRDCMRHSGSAVLGHLRVVSVLVIWAARWLVQCGNDLGVISVTCNYFRSVIAARRSLVTETELRTASVDVLLLRIVNDYFNGV